MGRRATGTSGSGLPRDTCLPIKWLPGSRRLHAEPPSQLPCSSTSSIIHILPACPSPQWPSHPSHRHGEELRLGVVPQHGPPQRLEELVGHQAVRMHAWGRVGRNGGGRGGG